MQHSTGTIYNLSHCLPNACITLQCGFYETMFCSKNICFRTLLHLLIDVFLDLPLINLANLLVSIKTSVRENKYVVFTADEMFLNSLQL